MPKPIFLCHFIDHPTVGNFSIHGFNSIGAYHSRNSFDEIVALYQFDAELKELFLKYLLQIERHVGNLMTYYFMELYGISQAECMNTFCPS
ncbi:MAG: Abi family protein [Lachnospiraceae bacterium]|nr:Abi family protein [Lachnospiraceae bacterium]